MLDTLSFPEICLASSSPRRRELLDQLGVSYHVVKPDIDETMRDDESPEKFVLRMAQEKARAGQVLFEGDAPVLGADTIVVIKGRVLGKPVDQADALAMLKMLSGQTHQVMTAVALLVDDKASTEISISSVTFRELSEPEMLAYWASGEPQDKAGGYAIQGLAAMFIERLEGSFSGVMGLPLFELSKLLTAYSAR